MTVVTPRRSLLRVAVIMLPVLAAASCKSERAPAAAQDVLVELRGPDGHLRLQVARAGDNFGDQRLSWYAGPQSGGNLQSLPGGAGTTSVDGTRVGVRRTQDGGLVLTRNGSVQLNVERRGSVLRLGNAEGFPTGRIQGDGKTARLDGPGGDLQAQAQLELRERIEEVARGVERGDAAGLQHGDAVAVALRFL